MSRRDPLESFPALLVDERDWIAVRELCALCRIDLQALTELADLGIVSPRGAEPRDWELPASALPRLRTASRLMHDLGVNVSGVAVALELIEAQRDLERRLRQLERLIDGPF